MYGIRAEDPGRELEFEALEAFDVEHAALLERIAPEEFGVLHRIDGLVLRPCS